MIVFTSAGNSLEERFAKMERIVGSTGGVGRLMVLGPGGGEGGSGWRRGSAGGKFVNKY